MKKAISITLFLFISISIFAQSETIYFSRIEDARFGITTNRWVAAVKLDADTYLTSHEFNGSYFKTPVLVGRWTTSVPTAENAPKINEFIKYCREHYILHFYVRDIPVCQRCEFNTKENSNW